MVNFNPSLGSKSIDPSAATPLIKNSKIKSPIKPEKLATLFFDHLNLPDTRSSKTFELRNEFKNKLITAIKQSDLAKDKGDIESLNKIYLKVMGNAKKVFPKGEISMKKLGNILGTLILHPESL